MLQYQDGEWPPERIKDLRRRLGLTLKEFAEQFGVTVQACQRWLVPETASTYSQPRGAVVKLLDQLDAEARISNPNGLDLLTDRQREGKSAGGRKGAATLHGHQNA